jgi:universal stress protein E
MTDKNILVVVDPLSHPEEQPAVERAAWLAERAGAGLELVISDFDPDIDRGAVAAARIPPPVRENLIAIHAATLEKLAAPLRKRGLDVTTDVVWDHPLGASINRKVAEARPWLVAKDTHHHTPLGRALFTNTDWNLIRGCPAPLWLVKPRALSEQLKVFAAVDPLHERDKPAELDDKIFAFADALAAAAGGELHVVHTYYVPINVEFPGEVINAITEQHHRAMSEFVAKHGVPEERVHVAEGRPEALVPKITKEAGADFVVSGAISRSGLNRLFVGSTAERMLDKLPCDLVTVKPEGFEAP